MPPSQLEKWFVFLQGAPTPIRKYLEYLFWAFVALLLVWFILKLLFNRQFKELYAVLGSAAKVTAAAGRALAKSAAEGLKLPEPYPRLARFFAIVFMVNTYLLALVMGLLFLFVVVLTVVSTTPSFWGRTLALLLCVVFGYLAWFMFAEAERARSQVQNLL